MLYWFADAVLSILFLLIGALHLGLSKMPVMCWLVGGSLYSFIFHFAICKHRAIPRFVIIMWFLIRDLQHCYPIGSTALAMICSIELVRLYLDFNDRSFKRYQAFNYIMFSVFVCIYHALSNIIIKLMDYHPVSIGDEMLATVLAIGMHMLLKGLWSDLYISLYRYHSHFVR